MALELAIRSVQARYTGKERDTESGLDNFGARYYGSSMGRYLMTISLKSEGADNARGRDS